jgi:hypothetical protein
MMGVRSIVRELVQDVLMEDGVSLQPHPLDKMRNQTASELGSESGEYFHNKVTKSKFPGAFKDKHDFVDKVGNAPVRHLTNNELHTLDNSDVGDVLNHPNPPEHAERLAKDYGRDIHSVYRGIEHGKIPHPIVLKHGNQLHLLGGNTRLMAGAAKGRNIPAKVVDVGPPKSANSKWDVVR